MKNIDPRLLEAPSVPIAMALPSQSDTEIFSSSGGSLLKEAYPNSAETPIRQSTRSTAKVTEHAPAPESESQPQHVKRSSQKTHHAEKPQCGERKRARDWTAWKLPKGLHCVDQNDCKLNHPRLVWLYVPNKTHAGHVLSKAKANRVARFSCQIYDQTFTGSASWPDNWPCINEGKGSGAKAI